MNALHGGLRLRACTCIVRKASINSVKFYSCSVPCTGIYPSTNINFKAKISQLELLLILGSLIEKHPSILGSFAVEEETDSANKSTCKKDLGGKQRLKHWSRGHVFICRPCMWTH